MKKLFVFLSLFVCLELQAHNSRIMINLNQETESQLEPFAPVDGPVATGINPGFVIYSHSGKFAAIVNGGDDTISFFDVDPVTGELIPAQFATVETGPNPTSISFSPCDNFAIVTNFDHHGPNTSLMLFARNCKTGEMSLIQTLQAPINPEITHPFFVSYSPNGRFVAVTNLDINVPSNNNIAIYHVSPISGRLLLVQTDTTMSQPFVLGYRPDGKILQAVNFPAGIYTFSVNSVTGEIAFVNLGPSGKPNFSLFSHNGKFVAVSSADGNLYIYTIDEDGTIGAVSGTPFPASTNPYYLAYSENDKLLAVTDSVEGIIEVYCVDANGAIILQQTLQNPPAGSPDNFTGSGIAFQPCDDFAAATSVFGNSVSVFEVNETICP